MSDAFQSLRFSEGLPSQFDSVKNWAKQNLFSDRLNTTITIICSFIIYYFLSYCWDVVFNSNWDVIWENRVMLTFGPYFTRTPEEMWRFYPSLFLVMLLVGSIYGTIREKKKNFIIPYLVFSSVLLYLVYLPSKRMYDPQFPLIVIGGGLLTGLLSFVTVHHFYANAEEYRINKFRKFLTALAFLTFLATVFVLDPPGEGGVAPSEWGGLMLNLIIASAGGVLAFVIGIALAFGRQSRLPLFKYPSIAIIEFVRSGPMIAWLFIAYILMPDVLRPVWDADSVSRTIFIVGLFGGCYLAEVLRGGLQAVPRGQIEAATALGLSPIQTKLQIVLPNAIRTTLPAIVSLIIGLWKDTSLVYLLGVHDMFNIAKILPQQWDYVGLHREAILFAGLIFWIVAYYFSRVSRRIEASLGLTNEGGGDMT